jgi:hypothetical protein
VDEVRLVLRAQAGRDERGEPLDGRAGAPPVEKAPRIGQGGAQRIGNGHLPDAAERRTHRERLGRIFERNRFPGRHEFVDRQRGVRKSVRVVKMYDAVRHGRDDHEVVGVEHLTGSGVVQQEAELDRPDEHRAVSRAQPVHRVCSRAARCPLAGPSEQVDGRIEAQIRIPAERVEPRQPAAQVEPERRAGEHLDRRRRRGGRAEDHRQRIRVAVGTGTDVANIHIGQRARFAKFRPAVPRRARSACGSRTPA